MSESSIDKKEIPITSKKESTTEKKKENEKVVKESFADLGDHMGDMVYDVLTKSNIHLLAGFLILYLVIFFITTAIFGSGWTSFIFDVTALIFGFSYLWSLYTNTTIKDSETLISQMVTETINFYKEPVHLFSTMFFMFCFYLLAFLVRIPVSESRPITMTIIEIGSWLVLATLVYYNLMKYVFDIDPLKDLRFWMGRLRNKDRVIAPQPLTPEPKEEVFNIGNNLYSYDDAQAICKAHNARLATYDEVEDAYNNGAEWCNYGWSADQMAFFPTQKDTWKELQNSEKHKNSCGRPGVNGGYFANPHIRFGVNCFGYKPEPTEGEMKMMETRKDRPYPRTEEEKKMDEKIEYWKNKGSDNLYMNSFSRKKWSQF